MMMEMIKNIIDVKEEKNIKNTYLYIKNIDINIESYETKLVTEENIENVLKPQISYEGSERVFKFDVSSTISLEEYLRTNKLGKEDVCNIVTSIDNVLTSAENYLISENSLSLDPRLIRLKKDCYEDLKLSFVIIPNHKVDFSYELSKFLIRVLRYIDVNDKEALSLAYGLFVRSSKEDYVMNDLMDLIDKVQINNVSKNNFFEDDEFRAYDESLANEIDEDIINENKYDMIDVSDMEDEYIGSDFEKRKYNGINEGQGVFESNKDIDMDDDTREFLENELFEDFDKEDKKIINFAKKNKKKKLLNAHIKMDFICYVITPLALVAMPILYYFINGSENFLNNIITILTFEFFALVLLVIGRLVNYRMEKV